MMNETYRAIYLGNDQWAVRRFNGSGIVHECQLIFHVPDPQLRSFEKLVIDKAKSMFEWKKL